MPNKVIQTVAKDAVGFDSLFEDIAGINIMGFKSIWAAFFKPAGYFEAAKHHNWNYVYRPSLRVWFGITALSAALAFLWAGPKTAMHELYTEVMNQIALQISETPTRTGRLFDLNSFDPSFAAETLLKWYMVFLPFVYILIAAILAFIYRAWGEKLTYATRFRYLFIILTPAAFFGLIMGLLSRLLEGPYFQIIMNGSLLVMAGLMFSTAYYGPFQGMNTGGRIGRSLGAAAILTLTMLLATLISMIIAMFPMMDIAFKPHVKYLPEMVP